MANTIPTPNMALPVPIPTVTPGPDYALNQSACFGVIDSHDHSPGKGVPITPAGLNVNADLPFGNNNLISLRSTRYQSQPSALGGPLDLACTFVVGADLYFNDGNGNVIRMTQSGSVAGSAGTITGLPSGTASASFGSGTFVFQAATSTAAQMDIGSLILRNSTANSHGLTLAPPTAMPADMGLVLPSIPGSLSFLTLDTSGNISTVGSVSAAQIASASIQGSQIDSGTVTGQSGGNIASATIDGSNLVSAINLPGAATAAGNLISVGAAARLVIVRGRVAANGTKLLGEGFTSSHFGTGNYGLAWSTAFSGEPVVTVTPRPGTFGLAVCPGLAQPFNPTTNANVYMAQPNGAGLEDCEFDFIAIGY